MKYPFYIAMLSLSMISCENNDNTIDDPRPVDKNVYQFQFKSYVVKNTVLYQGAKGEKSTPDESYLNKYWSLYQEPAWEKISLDLKNKTIKLLSETSTTDFTYSFTMMNDSVMIKENNNNKPTYIGDFHKDTSSFTEFSVAVEAAPNFVSSIKWESDGPGYQEVSAMLVDEREMSQGELLQIEK
uniref:hypothetical protein n=1 Tax=Chryseobacterium cucumeris TaxID=1813611 RepID=UPI003C6C4F82